MLTATEIMLANEAAARETFERNTVAFNTGSRDVTIYEARGAFEAFHHTPGTDWKRPVDCLVPLAHLVVFTNACVFYHGGAAPSVVQDETVRDVIGRPFWRVRSAGYAG